MKLYRVTVEVVKTYQVMVTANSEDEAKEIIGKIETFEEGMGFEMDDQGADEPRGAEVVEEAVDIKPVVQSIAIDPETEVWP